MTDYKALAERLESYRPQELGRAEEFGTDLAQAAAIIRQLGSVDVAGVNDAVAALEAIEAQQASPQAGGEYPPLPEPVGMASIQGPQGSEYRMLSTGYEPDCAMFSPKQMRAYLDADRAARAQATPAQGVRMLTSDEVSAVLWPLAIHSPTAANRIQRKFAEVNGLTIPADGEVK